MGQRSAAVGQRLLFMSLCSSAIALSLTGCVDDPRPSPALTSTAPSAAAASDPIVHDLGAQRYAEGPVQALEPVVVRAGGPLQPRFAYTIVHGDTIQGIVARFEMCLQDFGEFNPEAVDVDLQVGSRVTISRSTLQPFTASCVSHVQP